MLIRPQVFRQLAIERYNARRESATLPKLRPPRQRMLTLFLLAAVLSAGAGLTVVSIPVHTTAAMTAVEGPMITIAPDPVGAPYEAGQRVFVRRHGDGVVIARGAITRLLASTHAEARVEGKPPSLSPPATRVVVETGRETLLHAIARSVRNRLLNHQPAIKRNNLEER